MKKKSWIKIGIVVVIMGIVCFSDWGFAAAESGEKVMFGEIAWFLNVIIGFLSWGWVIFARRAGEFLTNKWVYGEIIGLDQLLWKYWVIVRNIANFGLGFYFIYTIFIAFIKEGDIAKKVKDMLKWILIGGIGIQASWFFTAAVVDVSTITLVAVGSLPAQIISQNPKIQEDMHYSLKDFADENFNATRGMRLTLLPSDGNNNSVLETSDYPLQSSVPKKQFIDARLPSGEGEFGPLYYIGLAILKTNKINNVDFSSPDGLKTTILNTVIVGGTTIVYSIEMGVLCVLALIRIVYLWMFIVLSPLAILLRCIEKSGEKKLFETGLVKGLQKHINLKVFFINVFKPTIIVLGLGIALIFSILMGGMLNESGSQVDKDLGGLHILSEKDGDTYDTTISSDFFTYTLKNTTKSLLEMIISILTVILVYFIIKVSVELWESDSTIKKLQGNVESVMASVPIVPITGYDKNGALDPNAALSVGGAMSLSSGKLEDINRTVTGFRSEQVDDVMEGLGFADSNTLKQKEKNKITNLRTSSRYSGLDILREQKKYIDQIKTQEGKGMKLKSNTPDQYWIGEFESWLTSMKDKENGIMHDNTNDLSSDDKIAWKHMIQYWNKDGNDKKGLENMFMKNDSGQTKSVRAYANLFGLGLDIDTWAELEREDISKLPSKKPS